MEKIEDIKAKLDLRTLAEQAGARFTPKGYSPCPLHKGDNPTGFSLYEGGKKWKCWTRGCGSGDVIDFYRIWQGLPDNASAIKQLAHEASPSHRHPEPVEVSKPTILPPAAKWSELKEAKPLPPADYAERLKSFVHYASAEIWNYPQVLAKLYAFGWTNETIARWKIGYNAKRYQMNGESWGLPGQKVNVSAGLVYPYQRDGLYFGANIRLMNDFEFVADKPKTFMVTGSRRGLFGMDKWTGQDTLILAEGEKDFITLWQAAHDFADCDTLGGATQKPDVSEVIGFLLYKRIICVCDPDEAGRKFGERMRQLSQRIETVTPPFGDLTAYAMGGGNVREFLQSLVKPDDYSHYPKTFIWPDGVTDVARNEDEGWSALNRWKKRMPIFYCVNELGGVLAIERPAVSMENLAQGELMPAPVMRGYELF